MPRRRRVWSYGSWDRIPPWNKVVIFIKIGDNICISHLGIRKWNKRIAWKYVHSTKWVARTTNIICNSILQCHVECLKIRKVLATKTKKRISFWKLCPKATYPRKQPTRIRSCDHELQRLHCKYLPTTTRVASFYLKQKNLLLWKTL
jgi:hypothetical protein